MALVHEQQAAAVLRHHNHHLQTAPQVSRQISTAIGIVMSNDKVTDSVASGRVVPFRLR